MSIKIDVVTALDRTSTREAAREAQKYFADAGPNAGAGFMDGLSKAIGSKSPEVEKALRKVTDASGKVLVEQEKLNDLQAKGTATKAQLVVQSEKLAKAFREEESSLRDANRVLSDHDSALRSAEQAAQSFEVSTRSASSSMAEFGNQLRGMSAAAGPATIAAMGSAVADLAAVSASAAQSMIALPAVIGSVAVGIGTLKLATSGFSDALGAIRDPEKFSEALKQLSPNAQQAANSIRSLLPEFDQLKNATQDALFDGVGPQLNALTNQYLPTIQQMTTGVASAFGSMFSGAATQLMTPETMASIQTFADNVTRSFQVLAPAVAPVTKAFTDLMSVGSGVLPQLAGAATQAAQAFSAFITNASNSGQLQQWLSQGLNTVTQLGGAVWRVVEAFGSLAPTGRQILPAIVNALNETARILPDIIRLAANGGSLFQIWADTLKTIAPLVQGISWGFEQMNRPIAGIGQSISGLISPLTAVANLVDSIRWFFDPSHRDDALSRANTQLRDAQAQAAGGPGGGGVPGYGGGGGSFGGPGPAGIGPGSARPGGLGSFLSAPTPQPAWGERPAGFSAATGGGGGGAATPFVDPTKFTLGDPLAGMPAPIAGADQQAIFAADSKLITATHDLEQKKLALQVLEAKGTASQQELLTAKNDLQEKERALANAQAEDVAVRTGQMKKAAQGLQEIKGIFAPMDDDLGISGGLPGIAKYFTTLLGNFALAGAIRSSPTLQSAALGMIGGGMGGGGLFGGGALGGYGGDAALLSGVPRGRYDSGAKDLSRGLADCSSSVEDLVNMLDGRSTQGGSLTTNNAASLLPGMGFVPGNGGLGDFRIAYNGGHMQATLPGGTPFNWGSDAAAARGGVGGSGADDPALTQHYYRPVGVGPSAMGPAPIGGGLGAPLPGQWGPGGMPAMGGMGGGLPGMGMGMPSGVGAGGGYGAAGGVGGGVSTGMPSFQPAGGGGGGGGAGLGGLVQGAASAAGALDMAIPGAGMAASIGIKEAGRAIQYAGQAAAIGVGGLMETFLPHGSEAAGNSWVGKIASGISGASAAKPNQAGQSTPPAQGGPPAPQQAGNVQNGHTVNIEHMSTGGADGQMVGNDIARYQAGGPR